GQSHSRATYPNRQTMAVGICNRETSVGLKGVATPPLRWAVGRLLLTTGNSGQNQDFTTIEGNSKRGAEPVRVAEPQRKPHNLDHLPPGRSPVVERDKTQPRRREWSRDSVTHATGSTNFPVD